MSRARHTHAGARPQGGTRSHASTAAKSARPARAHKAVGARAATGARKAAASRKAPVSHTSANARKATVARKGASARNATNVRRVEQHKHAAVAPEAPETNKSPLLSRRAFVYGAVGVGAVAAVGVGAVAMSRRGDTSSETLDTLAVPQDAVVTQNDFEAIDDYLMQIKLRGTFDIPYGTLIWANDPDIAACLVPTESGSPLAKIAILHLSTGLLQNIREEAVGKADGFEILDVRANSAGAVWTESNIMEGAWRVYSARLNGGALETPALLDEGTNTYETPTLAAVGQHAFMQKIPKDTTDRENTSQLLMAPFGSSDTTVCLDSLRRSASPIYAADGAVVIAPRADASGVIYQLTRIDAATGEVTDTLALPQNMRPLEAAWGNTGFMFSFPDIYNYGDGISNLGTYVPFTLPENGDYSAQEWFGFARTPTAPPAWMDDLLIIKSTYAVCGVNLGEGTYFAIDVENGADTYGEYLASSGQGNLFVTYTNIDHTPIEEERIYACRVKVWERVSEAERVQMQAEAQAKAEAEAAAQAQAEAYAKALKEAEALAAAEEEQAQNAASGLEQGAITG